MLILSGLVIGAHFNRAAVPANKLSPAISATINTVQIETVNVVLGQYGFTPAAIERPAGAFRLTVENRSGAEDLILQIKRDGGGQVREWSVPHAAQAWSETIDLAPGGYVLTEANNPAWLFHITVQ